jgi:hypothetical protein
MVTLAAACDRVRRLAPWVTAALLVPAALFFCEQRAPDYDPQYARDIVERTIRFGGSYYENGIHNKGPLEPFVYHVAATFTSYEGFWLAIALMVLGAATVLSLAARRVVGLLGGPAWLGWSAGVALWIHLTLSGADYAGVLYSRNMTVTLLAAAFLLLTPPAGWTMPTRRRLGRVVAAGASLGLTVQTLQTAALTAGLLVLFGLRALPAGRAARRGPSDRWCLVIAAAVAFASAPLYYAVGGPWREFWGGWWTYGRYMSAATGRSLFNQLTLGWNQFYGYTRVHAPAHLAALAFIALGVAQWSRLSTVQRRLHVVLPLWWVAAWFEIILTQRYSSHYFVVTTFPLALMIAGVGVHLVAALGASGVSFRRAAALPYVVIAVSLFWSGTSFAVSGLRAASEFTGSRDLAAERARARDGTSRGVQALLDLTTDPGDPMLTWTNYPWPYLDFHRVSATRFIWKSFLMGEIYLGATGPQYVLPGSWDDWADDIAETDPQAFLTDATFPLPADQPVAEVWAGDFVPLLTTPTLSVAVRPAVRDALLDPTAAERWRPSGDADGWALDGTTIVYDGTALDETTARLSLGDMRCSRWEATMRGADGGISFHFDDPLGEAESVEIYLDGADAVSRSANVELMRLPARRADGDRVSLLVGTRSAVMFHNGVVVGALDLLATDVVTITSTGDSVQLADPHLAPAPDLGECA